MLTFIRAIRGYFHRDGDQGSAAQYLIRDREIA